MAFTLHGGPPQRRGERRAGGQRARREDRAAPRLAQPHRPPGRRRAGHQCHRRAAAGQPRHGQQVAPALRAQGPRRPQRRAPQRRSRQLHATRPSGASSPSSTSRVPEGETVWTARLLARALGDVSEDHVWRVFRRHGIHLQRRRSWCVSTDPEFAAKAADIVALYLAPPENALVICVDEKPQIQAAGACPGLPALQ